MKNKLRIEELRKVIADSHKEIERLEKEIYLEEHRPLMHWLEKAPIEWRDAAISNHQNQKPLPKDLVDSLHRALTTAFSWSDTKEGYDYWNNIYSELEIQKI